MMQLQLEKAGITPHTGPGSPTFLKSEKSMQQPQDSMAFLSSHSTSLQTVLDHMSKLEINENMFAHASPELLSVFAYSFELLRAVTSEVEIILRENLSRDEVIDFTLAQTSTLTLTLTLTLFNYLSLWDEGCSRRNISVPIRRR